MFSRTSNDENSRESKYYREVPVSRYGYDNYEGRVLQFDWSQRGKEDDMTQKQKKDVRTTTQAGNWKRRWHGRAVHQENSKLLGWPELGAPVTPARQYISWVYVGDMPESSTCAGGENHWYQSSGLDLVHSPGTSLLQLLSFWSFS